MSTIKTLKTKKLIWVDVSRPAPKNIDYLKNNFHFHEVDLAECLPPLQTPKVIDRPSYLFLILLFPIFNPIDKTISASEVDFFISANSLATVHANELLPLKNIIKKYHDEPGLLGKKFENDFAGLIHEILNELILNSFRMLKHLNEDVDQIERGIFLGNEREMIKEILRIKKNIINFRKTIQPHKNVIQRLSEKAPRFLDLTELNIYYKNLVDHTKDIWEVLENLKESVFALENTNNALVSFQLNSVMKTLTLVAVIIFPLSLLAGIFNMHVTDGMPFLDQPNNFWIVVGGMFAVAAGMIWFYKKKKWM